MNIWEDWCDDSVSLWVPRTHTEVGYGSIFLNLIAVQRGEWVKRSVGLSGQPVNETETLSRSKIREWKMHGIFPCAHMHSHACPPALTHICSPTVTHACMLTHTYTGMPTRTHTCMPATVTLWWSGRSARRRNAEEHGSRETSCVAVAQAVI